MSTKPGTVQPAGADFCGSSQARYRSVAAAEQVIRGNLRPFGLKVEIVSRKEFAGRVRELIAGDTMLEAIMDPMLAAREALTHE